MRKLALLAAFAMLVGGAAFAQQDMGNASSTGASFTTGVVESIDSSALTIKEDTNRIVTLLIDKGTVGADNHQVGSRVRVTFHKNDTDQRVATEIQGLGGQEAKPTAVVVATPVMPTQPAPQPTYVQKTVVTPEPTPMREPLPEPMAEPAPSLPRGASPLATFGLLGLIALGGALALRFKS